MKCMVESELRLREDGGSSMDGESIQHRGKSPDVNEKSEHPA